MGIIDRTQQPAAPSTPQDASTPPPESEATEPMPDDEGAEGEQPNVSPDEQKIYDTVVTGALNLIYGSQQAFAALLMKLGKEKDNPAHSIGATAAMIMRSVKQTATQGGKTIPDDIMFAAAQEVVGDIVTIAEGAGIITHEQAQTIGEEAFYEGMKVYGQAMQDKGEITPEMQQQAKADLAASGHQMPQGAAPAAAPPTQQPQPGAM